MTGSVADPLAEVARWDAAANRSETPCGDGKLVWRSWGQGRPLLLLHGGAGYWRHWIRNLAALTAHHRVFAPDLPGLGDSDMPPHQPWTVVETARLVADGLVRQLPPNTCFDVMGFSFGTLISGGVAASRQDRVGRIVLVGASGLGFARGDIVLEKVRGKTGEVLMEAHRTNLERLMIADPQRVDAQALAIQDWNTTHARLRSVGLSATSVLRDLLQGVPARLSAIWGGQDAVARKTLAERRQALQALQPDADVRIIPRAGHWVAYEAADTFNTMAAEMLGDA